MDFARTVLNIPVPRVLAWSSEPTEVGTDFSIWEKTAGTELSHVWSQTVRETVRSLLHVSRQINSIDQKFLDNPLSSYGSLFHKKVVKGLGLPHEPLLLDGKQDEALKKFAVGPMVSWDFWRDERARIETDRGPCESVAPPLHDLFSLALQGRIRLHISPLSSGLSKNGFAGMPSPALLVISSSVRKRTTLLPHILKFSKNLFPSWPLLFLTQKSLHPPYGTPISTNKISLSLLPLPMKSLGSSTGRGR